MAFSRNSLVAAVAGTLSLAMLTGCPGPTQTPGTGTPTTAPGATTAPTTAPGGDASPAAPASQAPGASVAPSTTPSATPLQPTTLRGKVYDLDNAVVNTGAKVTVKSLNPSSPFESTVDVIAGSYVVNNVPAGVQLEITAARTGWTSRTRVETLLPLTSTQPNIVNFGGVDEADTEGTAYFISKYPEVSAVEPAEDAENVDPTKLVVKLTLSEPLDSTNQRRFANAVRVWPANTEAGAPNDATADLEDQALATGTPFQVESAAGVPSAANGIAYVAKQGSIFSDDDASRATVTWDAAGQVATLTFNAPLQTGESDPGKYVIGLVGSSADPIKDNENNVLGTDATGALNTQSGAGVLIYNAFREPDLSAGDATTAATRWAETHDNVSTFEVAEDNTDPTLQSVSVVEVSGQTRIQLTFSEPMGVFAGSGVVATSDTLEIADLGNFTFAVAETAEDLNDVDLDGDVAATVAGGAGTTFSSANEEKEFSFASVVGLQISNTDPKTVRIIVPENFFADNLNAIKARVEAVADPAGNAITESQADAQVKTGTI